MISGSLFYTISTLPDHILHQERDDQTTNNNSSANRKSNSKVYPLGSPSKKKKRGKNENQTRAEFPVVELPQSIQVDLMQTNSEYFLSLVHHLYSSAANNENEAFGNNNNSGKKKRSNKKKSSRKSKNNKKAADETASLRGLSLIEFFLLLGSIAMKVMHLYQSHQIIYCTCCNPLVLLDFSTITLYCKD